MKKMVDFTGEVKFNTPDSLKESGHSDTSQKKRWKKRNVADSSRKSASGSASVLSTQTHQSRLSTRGSVTSTFTRSSKGGSTLSRTNREMEEHDKKSKMVVKRLKCAILLFFTLTAVGVATAFFVYRNYNTRTQETAFKKKFKEEAENMLASIGANLDSTLGAADAFVISMLAQAEESRQTYPYVTINNFGVQAGKFLKNSGAKYIATYSMVPKGERLKWENYTSTHNQWIDRSIEIQSRDPGYTGPEITQEFIDENYKGNHDLIHDYDEAIFGWGSNSTDGVDHEGPYLPVWQAAPVIPIDPIYNWCVKIFLICVIIFCYQYLRFCSLVCLIFFAGTFYRTTFFPLLSMQF